MQSLLNRIDAKSQSARTQKLRRYAALVQLGDDAPESAADELLDLLDTLHVSRDQLRQHVNAVREVRRLKPIAAKVQELSGAATAARQAHADKREELKLRREQLLEEEMLSTRVQSEAADAHRDAIAAAGQLQRLLAANSFLFWSADGEPIAPPATESEVMPVTMPGAFDPRVAAIDRTRIYRPAELRADFGLDASLLKASGVPTMPDNETYFGAVVSAWVCRMETRLRKRRRGEIDARLIAIGMLPTVNLDPDRVYTPSELSQLGLPGEILRKVGTGIGGTTGGEGYVGSDVAFWLDRLSLEREDLARELEGIDAIEQQPPARADQAMPIATSEPQTPEPSAVVPATEPEPVKRSVPAEVESPKPANRGGRSVPSRRRS